MFVTLDGLKNSSSRHYKEITRCKCYYTWMFCHSGCGMLLQLWLLLQNNFSALTVFVYVVQPFFFFEERWTWKCQHVFPIKLKCFQSVGQRKWLIAVDLKRVCLVITVHQFTFLSHLPHFWWLWIYVWISVKIYLSDRPSHKYNGEQNYFGSFYLAEDISICYFQFFKLYHLFPGIEQCLLWLLLI